MKAFGFLLIFGLSVALVAGLESYAWHFADGIVIPPDE